MAYVRVKIMKTGIIPMTQSGAILGRPGQYKSPPFLMMPGNPVLEEVTLYDFQVNEIPEPEDLNNIPEDYGKELVVVSQRTAKAYTYYCDLDADAGWDDTPMWNSSSTTSEKKACLEARNMTGDGSRENPWKNLTYALEQLQCFVTAQCCHYVRLVCTGTAHYTACAYSSVTYRNTDFSGNGIFILDGANMEFSRDGFYVVFYGFNYCDNSIFYNCTAEAATTEEINNNANVYGFYYCRNSIFYNCTAKATTKASSIGANLYGFNSCSNSIFYNCTVNTNSSRTGFSANNSVFYNCTTNFDNAEFIIDRDFISYDGERNYFYNCKANFSRNFKDRQHYGYNSDYSSYYNCTVNINGSSYDSFYGFDCSKCNFYNCNVILKITNNEEDNISSAFIYGFVSSNSIFFNTTVDIDLKQKSSRDVYNYCHFIDSSHNDTFYNCYARIKQTVETSSDAATVESKGFFCSDSNIYNCNYSLSSVAKATPYEDGSFWEYEYECGIYCDGECQAGYRCEQRTAEGTKTC